MFNGIYIQQISGERLQDHWSSGCLSPDRLQSEVLELADEKEKTWVNIPYNTNTVIK